MAKSSGANYDLFTGTSPVKPESRAEKVAKQRELRLRSDGMPGETMQRLWKARSSIKSKRTHWSASTSTKTVACGVPTAIAEEATILVELVNCEACQRRAKEAWEVLIGRYAFNGVEEGDE